MTRLHVYPYSEAKVPIGDLYLDMNGQYWERTDVKTVGRVWTRLTPAAVESLLEPTADDLAYVRRSLGLSEGTEL